ncbi:TonB-dependent hemoglobin/transferrin/lactoferrin family receptor [Lonepinella sp. BR2882]|uniref:TonB-dependent hemoglobin/transferrin/lactoferrin family receptor n=1 Tax=Lonepinella sp. BR2882 TaxID=3095283 RepID=UPI003F6DAAA6
MPKRNCFCSFSLITLAVLGYSQPSFSEESSQTETLDKISVTTEGEQDQKPAVIKKTHQTIQRELIRDTRDLVRYTTDVGVADNGRRLKGFSIHGVEANRVNISIDGVNLPDAEENSLYARYGNFNNSRLSIDSELVKSIDVVRGSDSVNSGSGALGGSVNYHTLDAQDIVFENQSFGGLLRSGYASKNREWVNTAGLGYVDEKFDALLMYSHRQGHELKSAGGNITPWGTSRYDTEKDIARRAEVGSARIHPDPSDHKLRSYLAKFNWKITPEHKLGVAISGQNNKLSLNELSYDLDTSWRDADDYQKRINTNLFYEWKPTKNTLISLLRADFDYQKTENGATNYKGDYDRTGDWRNGYDYTKGKPFNVDDRNMETKYKRFSLRLDSQPFQLGGDHLLSFKSYIAQRDFENINNDKILNKTDGSVNQTSIYTIQRPVKTNLYGFGLQDNIYWNDIFSSVIGVRYDHTTLKPQNYQNGVPCSIPCMRAEERNAPKNNSYNNWSGSLGLEAQINPVWKTGYNISTGFRVPTASEIYFTFDSRAGNWKANPDLKAERSINHNLYLQANSPVGMLDVNLFYTRYKNFLFEQETIDLYYEELCDDDNDGIYCHKYSPAPFQQMVNIDNAKIYGLEVKGSINLHEVSPLPDGFKISGALGYNKGKLSNGDSLLSIQPLKLVIGFDYEDPNGVWGIFSRVTYQKGKRGKDAMITERDSSCVEENYFGLCEEWEDTVTHREYRWLNKSYWVADLFGYYRPTKSITLRAGVYNIFDTKYHTWDSLRGINYRSTINTVDYRWGNQGLERFYAPGRNYSASVEIRF